MIRLSLASQLIEFNKRILYNGEVDNSIKYSMDELLKLFFFNKVFVSNMDEVFEKYDMMECIGEYKILLNQYQKNMDDIVYQMEREGLKFVKKDNFEIRHLENVKLLDCETSMKFSNYNLQTIPYQDNKISYISITSENVILSIVDENKYVYDLDLHIADNMNIYQWMKNDLSIGRYLHRKFDALVTVEVKVTSIGKSSNIRKVEYHCIDGSESIFLKNVNSLFSNHNPNNKLAIMENKYLYIDDIERIIKIKTNKKYESQNVRKLTLNDIYTHDTLLAYPDDSFDQFLYILRDAVSNPYMKSIYITLYRIGHDDTIYHLFERAILNGIKVYVNIELTASGESINTLWMREFENIGVNVTNYGEYDNIKIHSKIALFEIVNGSMYAQIGTGNYHTETTHQYTDLSLITTDDEICNNIKRLFYLFSNPDKEVVFSNNLLVSRYNMRNTLYNEILIETRKGSNGYISFKCNALDDSAIINKLDNAAESGCIIDLVVRGVCTWTTKHIGENVMIKSIIWDKLEHSRVYCFGSLNPRVYIGSVDLVTNKLDRRIETLVRVKDPDIIMDICEYMNNYITHTMYSWQQTVSGEYVKEK